MRLRINNRQARHLWLNAQGLTKAPTGALDLARIIGDLGYVQLDTIQNVTRAHHHILWSRNQNYREPMFDQLLGDERAIFEHFTHDASVLPMAFYPMWQRQFRRLGERVARSASHRKALQTIDGAEIKARIAAEGPLSTHAFETKITGRKQMWDRPPHKRILDQLWYAGELATSHRENFNKYYDLAERVIPSVHREVAHSDHAQMDWLCREALGRLIFASLGEIQRFWGAMSASEVKNWSQANGQSWISVEVQAADGSWFTAIAPPDIEQRLVSPCAPTSRLRIINPFDPLIRDRNRFARLFGFDYRIEIFVPAAKRKWGYYVYPLLEGDRFVGRIEIKADRSQRQMKVINFWQEGKVNWTPKRWQKLDAEIERLARLIGVRDVVWSCPRATG
ncbi:winged helix-turn-helix domain-containing protein [Parasphingorhabdus sp.]|jgi:uncharacterized protein YcaQ|uniref:winged helix-turn-helix domain-containing protein n=1 Tax=Parasphingorhabdus sp. TaxID=2709688 RepID=UPI0007F48232|nr:hypothetical protein A8B75_14710 [Sphingomonadales bacterium EhC05]